MSAGQKKEFEYLEGICGGYFGGVLWRVWRICGGIVGRFLKGMLRVVGGNIIGTV